MLTTVLIGLNSFLHSLIAFIAVLIPLVVFHEFGHFIFAKIFGVKAEVFSVGFGPKLFRKKIGETDFQFAAIPLGGYVKLLGEDREASLSVEDQKKALHLQAPWKRFFIFSGGPLFNFILSTIIFTLIFMTGEPHISSRLGRVLSRSSADQAGLKSGDQVVAINGTPIQKFEELMTFINENPEKSLNFKVMRLTADAETTTTTDHDASQKGPSFQILQLNIIPSKHLGLSPYGESIFLGELDGIFPSARSTQVGISDPNSLAAQEGIHTGDHVIALNNEPLASWEALEQAYQNIHPGAQFTLEFQSQKIRQKKIIEWRKPQDELAHSLPNHKLLKSPGSPLSKDFGLYSSELFVEKVISKSPAKLVGIEPGDRLIRIYPSAWPSALSSKDQNEINSLHSKEALKSFFDLKKAVQTYGEKDGKFILDWERQGKPMSAEIHPTASVIRDPVLNKITQYTIGIVPLLSFTEPQYIKEKIYNPFKALFLSLNRVVDLSWKNLVSLKKILFGETSVGGLGGPLTIGKIAGESLSRGFTLFFTNMAVFSIGLGVLNILPIPILDGGHILLLGIEVIRRKPLNLKQLEIIQSMGLVLILILMGIAFHNDIARFLYS